MPNLEKIGAALSSFMKSIPQLDTPTNRELLCSYVKSELGDQAAELFDSWEIAFQVIGSQLKPDADFIEPGFKAYHDGLSGAEAKRLYLSDPEFKRQSDILDRPRTYGGFNAR